MPLIIFYKKKNMTRENLADLVSNITGGIATEVVTTISLIILFTSMTHITKRTPV
jgi:hypothetical protein